MMNIIEQRSGLLEYMIPEIKTVLVSQNKAMCLSLNGDSEPYMRKSDDYSGESTETFDQEDGNW